MIDPSVRHMTCEGKQTAPRSGGARPTIRWLVQGEEDQDIVGVDIDLVRLSQRGKSIVRLLVEARAGFAVVREEHGNDIQHGFIHSSHPLSWRRRAPFRMEETVDRCYVASQVRSVSGARPYIRLAGFIRNCLLVNKLCPQANR